jgi:dTMP kinase
MKKHNYKGKLIAFEGVNGSGKSLQLHLLKDWLQIEGYGVVESKREESKLLAKTIKDARRNKALNYITYSLIYAADTIEQLNREIIPALKAGFIVLVNKYVYASFVRDTVRGNDSNWVMNLYDYAIEPDITFCFKTTADRSLEQLASFGEIDFYDAGMDIGLSPKKEKSFIMFQEKLIKAYEIFNKEYNFQVIEAVSPVRKQQQQIRELIKQII